MNLSIDPLPNVGELHTAYDGEGLLLSGYAADFSREDRHGDTIDPAALDTAVKRYMLNPVLLYSHKRSLPAVGKVLKAEVRKAGLWIEALLPRAEPGTFAAEIWNAAKNGVLKAFSIGGRFLRAPQKDGGPVIVSVDLQEISLANIGVSPHTYADTLTPTHVKALGEAWIPVEHYAEAKALTDEIEALSWLRDALTARRELDALRGDVAMMRLGIRSRR